MQVLEHLGDDHAVEGPRRERQFVAARASDEPGGRSVDRTAGLGRHRVEFAQRARRAGDLLAAEIHRDPGDAGHSARGAHMTAPAAAYVEQARTGSQAETLDFDRQHAAALGSDGAASECAGVPRPVASRPPRLRSAITSR